MTEFRLRTRTSAETLAQDLRYALRILAKSPGFTSLVVLMVALGIGANTAVFSIVNAVILTPLPYKDSERLVVIWEKVKNQNNLSKIFNTYADFKEFRDHSRSFDQLAAATWATGPQSLTGRGPARGVTAIPASVEFFSLLGVAPALGRVFQADDLNRGCTVVLAHSFWNDLGGAREIIGQNLTLDQKDCTVIGVMPAAFAFYPEQTNLWTLITPDFKPNWEAFLVGVFGHLKPGVSLAAAQAEMSLLHDRFHQNDKVERDWVPVVYPLQEEFTWLAGRNLRLSLMVLFAAVSFVLVIACVNVANLLLGRSLVRQRELAIRAALGSGRKRLMRQLLTEGLVLSSVGASLGILIAEVALRIFRAINPVELPPGTVVAVDPRVLGFTALLTLLTTLLFGLAPAWKASRIDLNDVLKAAGRGFSQGLLLNRFAKALVITEVTLSLVLLAGAGLLMESVLRLGAAPLGMQPENVATMRITLPKFRYAKPGRQIRFYDELASRIRVLPGIEGVALTSHVPVVSGIGNSALSVEGRPVKRGQMRQDVGVQRITPDYFRAMGVPLHRGRMFEERDREGSNQVAIVNEALAQEYFPNENPIGRRIQVGDPDTKPPWLTITGVVGTEKRTIVYQEMNYVDIATVFRPLAQDASNTMVLVARARSGDAAGFIQRAVNAIDSDVLVGDVQTMEQRISKFLAYPRFRAALLGAFACLALLLTAIGLYGVLAQSVVQRTQEIGIRMALGAQKSDVTGLVVKQGMLLVVAGLGVGLAAAIALGRYLSNLLYGVKPTDPVALGAVAFALMVAALLATYMPARHASRVDPMVTLRHE